MNQIFPINEYFKIKREIENCDSFYGALYNLTEVSYSEKVETACISFDKEGNAINMLINPIFWSSLNDEAKMFVILHELYHVVYDHAKRIIQLGGEFDIGNIASDIVINHHLYEKIGVDRNLFDWERFCWVETCFQNEVVPTNKSFEYYYNKLKSKNLPQKELLGSHSKGEELENDNKKSNTSENNKKNKEEKENSKNKVSSSQEDKKNNNEFIPENFSATFKDILERNPELINEIAHSPDFKNLGSELKKHMPKVVGLGKGHEGSKVEYQPVDEKPTFHKLMKLLIPKQKDYEESEVEMWVGTHRRYTAFLKQNNHILLPNIRDEEKRIPNEKKEVWIFMDSSGSCHGMFHAFSTIVMALLKEKNVRCRAFAFGDDCEEVDVKNHRISFYSGNAGGFDCIEEKILKIMNAEKRKYPDNVVVLSDGGVTFDCINKLKDPKKWILLINNDYCRHLTPQGGKYFEIDADFFGLNKKRKLSF